MEHISLGREGEERAARFLKDHKYRILEMNWKRTYGELDIVAIDPDGTLVLVEVKTLNFTGGLRKPEDNMTRDKIAKFKRAANAYANEHQNLIDEKRGFRCDVLALTKIENTFIVKHYENV